MARTRTRAAARPTLRFDQRLVLHQFFLGLLGVPTFDALADLLKDPRYEGWDDEGVSRIHGALVAACYDLERRTPPGPSRDDLRRYDEHIYRHTQTLNHTRRVPITWKYFQYLALLFTEMYLDRYFRDSEDLRAALNRHVAAFNAAHDPADHVTPYTPADLRKLAFWMATGSGKTLLMHVHILQYQHYLALAGPHAPVLNRIILLTPNEGLSHQHLEELEASGINAELFTKEGGGLFRGQTVEIIDIHKLADDMGEKTVAVDAFEGNNLVLVDEGHRGAGGFDWKDKRDRLVSGGFSFEYSATFGQAMKAARNDDLTQEYARCILFDYSYRFFYRDGYGKDYQILNLTNDTEAIRHRYLVASLLAFYQQQRLYREHTPALAPYGIERPLWIFVGNSVAKTSTREQTDIIELLRFLAAFLADRAGSVEAIRRLLSGAPGFTATGTDPFSGKFDPLIAAGLAPADLYADILATLFNAPGGGRLRVEDLKAADGELALRVGAHEPFGVINVGDARAVARLCEDESELDTAENPFAPSLFRDLNRPASRVHLLLGSRKFTEGWSSWRVSSMGLLNVGKGEGAQIIQLFGRGVRLRGLGGSLKRSAALPPDDTPRPRALGPLETLNIFGVHADYMANFREYLIEEGLPGDTTRRDFTLPTVTALPATPLKLPSLTPGTNFIADGPAITLGFLPGIAVSLAYFPKLDTLSSAPAAGLSAIAHTATLDPRHLAFLDLDGLHAELLRHKRERGWHNLIITRDAIADLLANPTWYTLTAPAAELAFTGPNPLRRARAWQEIATILLKKYCDSFFRSRRAAYEAPRRRYAILDSTDPNFIPAYQFKVNTAHTALWQKLEEIKEQLAAGTFARADHGPLHAFAEPLHLYQPLVHLDNNDLTATPSQAILNPGERDFVADLHTFVAANTARFAGQELHLLRNIPKTGTGFAEATNFYPDFILWLVAGDHQYITFIDPKGIVRLYGLTDPKIQLHRTIKDIEAQLGDSTVTLNSFIVANTPHGSVAHWADLPTFRANHVLFQKDERTTYIRSLFDRITASVPMP